MKVAVGDRVRDKLGGDTGGDMVVEAVWDDLLALCSWHDESNVRRETYFPLGDLVAPLPSQNDPLKGRGDEFNIS